MEFLTTFENLKQNSEVCYYKDYRLKIIKKENGLYDVYDNKFAGRKTYRNANKEWVYEFIKRVLSKRKNKINKKSYEM